MRRTRALTGTCTTSTCNDLERGRRRTGRTEGHRCSPERHIGTPHDSESPRSAIPFRSRPGDTRRRCTLTNARGLRIRHDHRRRRRTRLRSIAQQRSSALCRHHVSTTSAMRCASKRYSNACVASPASSTLTPEMPITVEPILSFNMCRSSLSAALLVIRTSPRR